MAGWGKLVGFELWKLRLLSVAISYGMALALLHLLRRATPLGAWPAFALTLLFVLSPYVFGASFTLLTDNLALLFALLALERIERFRADGSLGRLRAGLPGASRGAVLTRQSFLWLALVAACVSAAQPGAAVPARRRARRCSAWRWCRWPRWWSSGAGWCPRCRPGFVRAVHRPPGRRARRAHPAHRRLHARAAGRLRAP